MEKNNKKKYNEFLRKYGNTPLSEDYENWETTEKGKRFNIRISSEILKLHITTNEKIVLGFIYSLNNIGGITSMNNKRIAQYLCLSENTISTTLKSLRDLTFIEKQSKGYVVSEEVVEELIIKSQIYNPSYINLLKNNFSKLGLASELYKRILVGNYTESKDIHKRPMSKFMQDIARDLGIID